jgi:hypothetical protein
MLEYYYAVVCIGEDLSNFLHERAELYQFALRQVCHALIVVSRHYHKMSFNQRAKCGYYHKIPKTGKLNIVPVSLIGCHITKLHAESTSSIVRN